jgi:acyl-CoA thioesterase I
MKRVNNGEKAARQQVARVSLATLVCAAGVLPAAALDAQHCQRARMAGESLGIAQTPRDLTVVAIGSSSTQGIASNLPSSLYPATLEATLKARWPASRIKVHNRGVGGEQLPQTLSRFETDVLALKPDVVIWQLGVNDVLVSDGVDDRKAMVNEGLARLTSAGIRVVLLDLQYAPRVIADRDTDAMQEIIADAAASGAHGRVVHFRRYALMKQLAERDGVAMSEMIVSDGLHMTDAMHRCVGRLLETSIVAEPVQSAAARR